MQTVRVKHAKSAYNFCQVELHLRLNNLIELFSHDMSIFLD